MSFVEDDDMIQTISADGSNNAFTERILPWRARRRDNYPDTQTFESSLNHIAINRIPIAHQIAWSGIERKCFHQLLCCPLGSKMFSDVKCSTCHAVMAEHDENIQYSKSGGGDRKEIYGCKTIRMVRKKSSPCLRRRYLRMHHIF